MRFTLDRTTIAFASLIAFAACDNGSGGSATLPPASGGTVTQPPASGGSVVGQGGAAQGGAANGGTPISNGGSATANGGSAKGGAAAGGAAAGGAGCAAPPTPVAAWKSFAACQATTAKMTEAYTSWRTSYFVDCNNGQAYIKSASPTGEQVVVSEGIGYGMLLSAHLGKSDDFSKLWAFYKQRLNNNGLMGWKYPMSCSGGAQDSNAASDADIDAAMALIVGAKVFGNATYLSDAKTLIAAVKKSETATNCNSGRSVLKASDGNWANCDELNPSYFAPGYYRVFGKVTNDSTFWDKMAGDAYALFTLWQSKMNGQVPDWGRSDGSLGTSSHSSGTTFGADACRTPWRVAVDYGWHQNADAKTFLTKMYEGILAKNRPYFATTDQQHTSAWVGGYATVGTGIDQATADTYFSDWYVQRVLPGDNTYYALTLRMLYLVTMGGRFDSGQ